ncbi:hypothetical protein GH714_027675 [Hevea brasiliensis]|uniref:Myb/SANT-like domain-containing protein n=1 Tax=Hevea brasiliensis TaxID=3981 RepID=A0A6A6N8G5_HEVBR|nr:hypothetical protein GH714_027675 [Hevea brasiliensis]
MMDFVKSSQVTHGRGKNKRIWTSEEDNALVEALQEVATHPKWKKENGWKNGYLLRVEELINTKLPNSGLKASPHINSRELVGRDRATGKGVETFYDAIENMEKEMIVDLDKDDLFEDTTGNHSVSQPTSHFNSKRPKHHKNFKEKKLKGSHDDVLPANFNIFMEQMNTYLGVIANVLVDQHALEKEIAYENKKVTEQKKMVLNELFEIEGLTEAEIMNVAVIFKAEQYKHEVFYELPTNLRKQFTINLLSVRT